MYETGNQRRHQNYQNKNPNFSKFSKCNSINNNKSHNLIKQLKQKGDLTVILDLDNTLISSFILQPSSSICDFLFTLQNDPNMSMIGVIKRPNVDSFLTYLSSFATIYLFTSAEKEYATQIISQIDPIGKYFSKIFTRENCIHTNGNKYKKDYSICGTDMSRTIIVDDIPENFKEYANNGIPIRPYKGGLNDNELALVLQIIIQLASLNDVRTGISN